MYFGQIQRARHPINKYDMPFVSFVGVKLSWSFILLGCGSIRHGDIYVVIWHMAIIMSGSPPLGIIKY